MNVEERGGPGSKCEADFPILVVDDDMFNLEILKDILKIKYSVRSQQASSGKIAIDLVLDRISRQKKNLKRIL